MDGLFYPLIARHRTPPGLGRRFTNIARTKNLTMVISDPSSNTIQPNYPFIKKKHKITTKTPPLMLRSGVTLRQMEVLADPLRL